MKTFSFLKKTATALTLILTVGILTNCSKESLSGSTDNSTERINWSSKTFIENSPKTTEEDFIELEFAEVSCDLSSYDLPMITTTQIVNSSENIHYPESGNARNTFGEFPSDLLMKSLTGILNDFDDSFLPITPPDVVTSSGRTRINRDYNTYRFVDYGYSTFDTDLGEFVHVYDYINGEVESSNFLKDVIACKLLEEAPLVHSNAFIWDIFVSFDVMDHGDPTIPQTYAATVYVKWAYNQ